MMVLWDKISQKAIKSLLTSSLAGKYDVIKVFFSNVPGQTFEFPYLLFNGADI